MGLDKGETRVEAPFRVAVTIRDIAKHCGVGRTAGSLALRDAPGVASTTRERILRTARELGYVGDPVVARLAERRWTPAFG